VFHFTTFLQATNKVKMTSNKDKLAQTTGNDSYDTTISSKNVETQTSAGLPHLMMKGQRRQVGMQTSSEQFLKSIDTQTPPLPQKVFRNVETETVNEASEERHASCQTEDENAKIETKIQTDVIVMFDGHCQTDVSHLQAAFSSRNSSTQTRGHNTCVLAIILF
jgi:hypothetical protein